MYFEHDVSNRKDFEVLIGTVLVGADYVRLRRMGIVFGLRGGGDIVTGEMLWV
jgi:hypothetical protein